MKQKLFWNFKDMPNATAAQWCLDAMLASTASECVVTVQWNHMTELVTC